MPQGRQSFICKLSFVFLCRFILYLKVWLANESGIKSTPFALNLVGKMTLCPRLRRTGTLMRRNHLLRKSWQVKTLRSHPSLKRGRNLARETRYCISLGELAGKKKSGLGGSSWHLSRSQTSRNSLVFLEVNQVIGFVQSVYVFKGLVGSVRGSAGQEGTSVTQFITLCCLKRVFMTCVPFTVATAALCAKSPFPWCPFAGICG